jgi:hypothetical protein
MSPQVTAADRPVTGAAGQVGAPLAQAGMAGPATPAVPPERGVVAVRQRQPGERLATEGPG